MANASSNRRAAAATGVVAVPTTGDGRDMAHLKEVPADKPLRERIRRAAIELSAGLDHSQPLARYEIEAHARSLLDALGQPETYLGWTMVAVASAFWEEQVAAVPCDRRLLLLPRCLRDEENCPAACDEIGLQCQDCGACCLTDLRSEAEAKGYRVLIAEGTPTVMQIILGGHVDALLGVACLDVLERSVDKILLAGVPCMAVPLLSNGCRNTSADTDWIRRMVDTPYRPARTQTRTYLHLMRCAARMFEREELARLIPPGRIGALDAARQGIADLDPVACTEAIAYDFLASGGKHSRPFITLAVYDALTGARATLADGERHLAALPDAVKRIALAIETFHKASLVHDDIEDDDPFRYGRPALHRQYGTATAINVGDYLIGLGYRMVAGQRRELGPGVAGDVLAEFAAAHTKLCEGQGAELIWRDARQKHLTPLEALRIYALKTAPAFEAALLAGIRLAGPAEPYRDAAAQFSRHLGVAYQIVNDLDDWEEGQPSKRAGGGDVLAGRPTVLWALAHQNLSEPQRRELDALVAAPTRDAAALDRAGELYTQAGVFDQAAALIAKHHQRAVAATALLESEPLRRLMYFIADAVLDRRPLSVSDE